jgi:osmoprotectant transport system permease protein
MNVSVSDFFLVKYASDIFAATGKHLFLVGWAIFFASIIGIPLGIVITRQANLRQPILGVANVLQTIPSLALFGFLLPIPYIGGIG